MGVTFAERLEEIMKERGVNAAWLTKETGISKGTISQYRSAAYVPKRDRLELLAEKLEVSPDWLCGEDVPMLPGAAPERIHRLPVVRRAIRGGELLRRENILRYETVAPEFDNGSYFFMEADNHLYPAARTGDLVLVLRCDELYDEQVGVVDTGLGGELCIFRRRTDHIELQYINARLEPVKIYPEQRLEIVGRVIETRRRW